jgi:hypothetical protein
MIRRSSRCDELNIKGFDPKTRRRYLIDDSSQNESINGNKLQN